MNVQGPKARVHLYYESSVPSAFSNLMQVFHWSRQAGNYAFLESWDQCLHGRLQVTSLSGRVGEISNMLDISMTIADPCI